MPHFLESAQKIIYINTPNQKTTKKYYRFVLYIPNTTTIHQTTIIGIRVELFFLASRENVRIFPEKYNLICKITISIYVEFFST